MIVHDEGESDTGSTPCKDSTLIVRQVLPEKTSKSDKHVIVCHKPVVLAYFVHLVPRFSFCLYVCVDHLLFLHSLQQH